MYVRCYSNWRADVCLLSPCVSVCVSQSKSPPPHQNSCSNISGPQSIAVWATANTAAPSVADSPHTAIFTILLAFPHGWPWSRGKAAARPECREDMSTEQGGGVRPWGAETRRGQEDSKRLKAEPKEDQAAFYYWTWKQKGVKGCQNTRSRVKEGAKTIIHKHK